MQMAKFTYEIVVNVGNYQSIRIGGEWSVTYTPTTEQVLNIDAGLRQWVAEVVESRKAAAQPQPQPTTEQAETKTEQASATEEENKPENKPQPQPQPQPQPETKQEEEKTENKPEPQQAEKPVDNTLELVPSNSPKFQAILKKIQAGTPEEVVRKYFRFDERGEQVIAIAYSDLIKENGKPIEELKDKLPHKEKPKDTHKDLPKIPNQKS